MLRSRLPQIALRIDVVVDEALEQGAESVADEARRRVRVRSGALHDKIHTDSQDEGTYVVAGDEDDVFYGHMVEHGTSHSAPYPFLLPALEQERAAVIGIVAAGLRGL